MDRQASGIGQRIRLADCAPVRIGNAVIDPIAHEARYGGAVERLQPQSLKVLIALRRQNGVVTRPELIDCCWDGRFVSDDVINRAILLLRGLATRAGGFTIETVPKSGYRLVETRRQAKRRTPLILLAAVTALVAAGAMWATHRGGSGPKPPSVALLPFTSSADSSARDQAAATAETLSHMLLDAGQPIDLSWPAQRQELDSSDLVISGDVRPTGAGLTTFVRVRDRRSGLILFSRQYEASRADAAALPRQIGAEMAANLSGALPMMVLDRRNPLEPGLAADLLKQIWLGFYDEDIVASFGVARRAAGAAPDSAIAQLGLAFDTGFVLNQLPPDQRGPAVRDGRLAAERALMLAPEFGDTQVPWCLLHRPELLAECEDRMRAGLKADPDAPFVALFLSGILSRTGRRAEALQFAQLALGSDRYNPNKFAQLERMLIHNGTIDEGDALFERARQYWPNHANLHWARIDGFILRGDLDGAERALALLPPDLPLLDHASTEPLFTARHARDWAAVRAFCLGQDVESPVQRLCLSALREAGDRESAFRLLDRMFPRQPAGDPAEQERLWLAEPNRGRDSIVASAALAWLRSDPRYLDVADRLGLVRYWRSGRLPDFCKPPGEPVCKALRGRTG